MLICACTRVRVESDTRTREPAFQYYATLFQLIVQYVCTLGGHLFMNTPAYIECVF